MKNSVFKNAAWIIACKIIQSLINLVIGLLTVRYLGPSNYGSLTYVMSVVAFTMPIMQLGLNQTLVKEFVQSSNQEGTILGTALVTNMLSSAICMIGSVAFVAIANAGEKESLLVCVLYSFTLLFQATEMTQFWFQSKLLSKYPSIASLCAYMVVALYKTYLLVTGKGVVLFALSNVLEYFLISVILITFYKKIGKQPLSFNRRIAREMLSRSKHYIIPSLMVIPAYGPHHDQTHDRRGGNGVLFGCDHLHRDECVRLFCRNRYRKTGHSGGKRKERCSGLCAV